MYQYIVISMHTFKRQEKDVNVISAMMTIAPVMLVGLY